MTNASELLEGTTPDFQSRVATWMDACFGEKISADTQERADRFIEEALELAQTMKGFNAGRAHALVDYVFGREMGRRAQEVGGVMVTLAALCNAVEIDHVAAAEAELARVWTKVDLIRAKQAAKPTGSALPIAAPDLARQVTQLEAQLAEVREVVSLASRTLKIITGELEQAGGGRSATADDVIGICDALLTKEPK